ncbi:hypothetical protein GCM10023331_21180 [Algivirga pacifica]|uniref:Uncharacterized protein n=1 Tax=Algivirga pacifica TaxID=1162670 RepID=A0ABP9DDI7_9BACT
MIIDSTKQHERNYKVIVIKYHEQIFYNYVGGFTLISFFVYLSGILLLQIIPDELQTNQPSFRA